MLGLAIDWGIAYGATVVIVGYDAIVVSSGFAITLVFVVLQIVFIPTLGGGIGHRLAGMRVVPLTGGWVGLWRPIVRSVLLGMVIPALVWDSDQRGFHDKVAGTVVVRSS